ncbi:DUF1919 domain-containing protein [Flavobacterium hungaricum]|uniref:DUF1919 domain-containing protein n=1 Tax=Flavobacterium hungaricum TaxID=2082725 RepID=A0ABR9TIP2_9FLAO|nr:DUF1919 domain-containing protein [Flavobacterium hungaricum]MBE8724537.1 DUF1919 domain-containing protein [Flavobacterium hungaricum]
MNNDFCIISNNCWGAEIYIERQIEYNSPFVGLFIPPLQFVKMANNLPEYLRQELVFKQETQFKEYEELYLKEKYPLALLGDIEIHFLHYKDEKEALSKWKRRLKRMPEDASNWFVKACDREINEWPKFITLWNSIRYKKVFFSAKKRTGINYLISITESYDNYVTDGKSLYLLSKDYFDVDNWIDSKGSSWRVKNISYKRSLQFLFTKLKYKIKKP